jgi:hypothetical protein
MTLKEKTDSYRTALTMWQKTTAKHGAGILEPVPQKYGLETTLELWMAKKIKGEVIK